MNKLHSKNTVKKPKSAKAIIALLALALLSALIIGVLVAYEKLHAVWLEQCVITDPEVQCEVVTSGKMIHAGTIRDFFDIREGGNLWQIDFRKKREEVLEKYPTIRAINISRHLPKKVTITVVEREPMVRMGVKGQKQNTRRVADRFGVVFPCARGVDMLPIIKEDAAAQTMNGKTLSGNTFGALKLIEASLDPEFQELGILEVDTTKKDYLLATLSNYQRAKLAWDGMNKPSERNKDKMLRVMRNLRDAINARLTSPNVTWNATEPDRVYADTKEVIK